MRIIPETEMKRGFWCFAYITIMGTIVMSGHNDAFAGEIIHQEVIYESLSFSLDLRSASIFRNEDDHIVMFYTTLSINPTAKTCIYFSVHDSNSWVKSEFCLEGDPSWYGLEREGVLRELYTIQGPVKSNVYDASSYKITPDLKLPKEPYTAISRKGSDGYGGDIRQLINVSDKPNLYFIIGQYTQFSLDPITLLGNFLSGGHGDRRERPYGALVENGAITGYYKIPGEKLRFRDTITEMHSVLHGDKVHLVWTKYQDAGSDREMLQYSCFDLNDKAWSKAAMPFSYKLRRDVEYFYDTPTLFSYRNILYCTWGWGVHPKKDKKDTVNTSGIYTSCRNDEEWGPPTKVADSGASPKMLADSTGSLYVFWCAKGKGILCKENTQNSWNTPVHLILADPLVRSRALFFHKRPFDLVFDKNNDLHIVYTRDPDPEAFTSVEQLVYAKVKLD